jgi:hypothetical protein
MRPHVLAAAAPGQGANRRLALEKAQRARRRLAHPAALAGQGSQPLTGVIKLSTQFQTCISIRGICAGCAKGSVVANIIVFHTAWMAEYDGDRASLSAGGFKWAAEHGYGHEMYNFRNVDGYYYGYVPPTGALHFEDHFSVPKNTKVLESAMVVWTAPHPEQGGRAVVGVWRDAKVYRYDQEPTGELARRRMIGEEIAGYRCTAEAKNCVLLKPEVRPIFVPSRQPRDGESWPGQQKVFYPKPQSKALERLNAILRDIVQWGSSGTSHGKKPKRSGWLADVEKRRRIEVAAVDAVGHHLRKWDLWSTQ